MTPEKLWTAFSSGTYPKEEFIKLGKSLFYGKPFGKLDKGPHAILADVATRAGTNPETLYTSINSVPLGSMNVARKKLQQFGSDVIDHKPWTGAANDTRSLITAASASFPGAASRPTAHGPQQSGSLAPGKKIFIDTTKPLDIYSLPFNDLYRAALMDGDDDVSAAPDSSKHPQRPSAETISDLDSNLSKLKQAEKNLREASKNLGDSTAALNTDNAKRRAALEAECKAAIAEVSVAIRQGRASRAAVERARDLARDCRMDKTASELDKVAKGMPTDGHPGAGTSAGPSSSSKPKIPGVAKAVLAVAAVAGAVALAKAHDEQQAAEQASKIKIE